MPATRCRRTSSPTPTSSRRSSPRPIPAPGARILEIGPGLGLLTGALLAAGATVTAVELDRGLAAFLRERFEADLAEERLRLIEGDALDQDLPRLVAAPYDVVANLPYHITSPILHALLGEPPRPRRLVLMVQREVAERIAAPPGKMSYLSVFVQYHARVRIAIAVPPTAFEPEPAVQSAVIVVEPFDADDRLDAADEDGLWRLVQAAFRERRKMIHNVLSRQLPVDAGRVAAALDDRRDRPRPSPPDPGRRGVAGAARGARAARRRPARTTDGRVSATRPGLAPVVRLAPAKINLTLAVVGRRGGRLPRPALGVRAARPGRPAQPGPGRRRLDGAGHAPRHGPRPGPGRRQPRAPRDRGRPRRGRARVRAARRHRRSPPASTSASRSRRDSAAGRPTRRRRSTARSRRGVPSCDPERRVRAAATIGSDVPFFLAGAPALVEGRGERVTPLKGVHGHPGILLVTPDVAVRTPDVFAVFAGTRGTGDGSVRMSSEHLAQELGNGLSATDLIARAGVLASANDLLSAALLVEPGLVPFRRALTRTLGRPSACQGRARPSGRSILRSAEAEAAIPVVAAAAEAGTIPPLGDGPLSIIATTIQTGHEEHAS